MVKTAFTRNIPADFLTSNHHIFGQIRVANTGLMGLLSDVTTSTIEVNDGSMARIVNPDKVINYSPVMWVVKEQLLAVSLGKREFVGANALVRGGYLQIQENLVQITTPVYELQGTLQYTGRFEFPVLLGDGTNPFVILYNATLVASLFPDMHLESEAMLVNRKFIDSLVSIKKKTQES